MSAIFSAYKEGREGVEIAGVTVKGKTKSELLKYAIYGLWKRTRQDIPAEDFYHLKMDDIIQQLRDS